MENRIREAYAAAEQAAVTFSDHCCHIEHGRFCLQGEFWHRKGAGAPCGDGLHHPFVHMKSMLWRLLTGKLPETQDSGVPAPAPGPASDV